MISEMVLLQACMSAKFENGSYRVDVELNEAVQFAVVRLLEDGHPCTKTQCQKSQKDSRCLEILSPG
jgi:hypothetical protein